MCACFPSVGRGIGYRRLSLHLANTVRRCTGTPLFYFSLSLSLFLPRLGTSALVSLLISLRCDLNSSVVHFAKKSRQSCSQQFGVVSTENSLLRYSRPSRTKVVFKLSAQVSAETPERSASRVARESKLAEALVALHLLARGWKMESQRESAQLFGLTKKVFAKFLNEEERERHRECRGETGTDQLRNLDICACNVDLFFY